MLTEAEYIEWSSDLEGVRAEWVRGEVKFMHAVSARHSELTLFIIRLIAGFAEENDLGNVWGEPFEIRFDTQQTRRAADVFFAANARQSMLEDTQFNGSPDLIVEVISKSSRTRDRKTKFREYQAAGVPEYWLPDPELRTFEAYTLNAAGKYELIPPVDGIVYSKILPGLFFRPEWVWQLKYPKVSGLIAEMSKLHRKTIRHRKLRRA